MGGGAERKTGLQREGRGSAKVPRPKVKEQPSQRTQHRALLGLLPTAALPTARAPGGLRAVRLRKVQSG